MNSSQTITKISGALVKAQLEMSNAKKDAVNPFFKKTYADLNAIREAVLPVLNKHGISAIQPTCFIDGTTFVETILLHESGEFISSLTQVVVDKVNDAQRHGSGLSYARRYALQSIVNIGAEDDDANGATDKKDLKKEAPVKSEMPIHPVTKGSDSTPPKTAAVIQPDRKALTTKAFAQAVSRITDATHPEPELIGKLRETYLLSESQEKELKELEKQPA